jgi:hypothetical protein
MRTEHQRSLPVTQQRWEISPGTKQPGPDKGRNSRATTLGANLQEAPRRHWNNRKYDASKLRFPHGKECVQKITVNLCTQTPPPKKKKFVSPVLSRKSLTL